MLNIKTLVTMLKLDYQKKDNYILNNYTPDDYRIFDNMKLARHIEDFGKLFGFDFSNFDTLAYLFEFIKLNYELLEENNYDISRYVEPKLKTFNITGEEHYSAEIIETYQLDEQAYSEEQIRYLTHIHEISISDGVLINEERPDIWDMEQIITDIEEYED